MGLAAVAAAAGVGEAIAVCDAGAVEREAAASLILCMGRSVPVNGKITSVIAGAASVTVAADASEAALCLAALKQFRSLLAWLLRRG